MTSSHGKLLIAAVLNSLNVREWFCHDDNIVSVQVSTFRAANHSDNTTIDMTKLGGIATCQVCRRRFISKGQIC